MLPTPRSLLVPTIASRRARRATASLLLGLVLGLAACAPREHRLDSFDMVDMAVTEMFQQLAVGLDMPHVLEIPRRVTSPTFDVHLKDVTATDVLVELGARDPSFQGARKGDVLVLWPTGAAEAASPFSVRVAAFQGEGGLGDVLSKLLAASGQPAEVRAEKAVGRRAVKLDVKDAIVRDVLADLAAQAHAALIVQPGLVSLQPVEPAR